MEALGGVRGLYIRKLVHIPLCTSEAHRHFTVTKRWWTSLHADARYCSGTAKLLTSSLVIRTLHLILEFHAHPTFWASHSGTPTTGPRHSPGSAWAPMLATPLTPSG